MIDRTLRARVLLEEAHRLGLDLRDLIAAAGDLDDRVPTLAAFVDSIAATFTPATAATYRPYWRLTTTHLGDRHLHDIDLDDLTPVVDAAVQRAQRSRPGSTGRSSKETCVAALRALFARATAAGLVTANPAAALSKPRRARSRRRALDDNELAELISAVRTTSRDPDLDLLLVRFHLESGARRQGALDLRCRDLDQRRATVWLREKGDTEREQPVSPSLVTQLARHVAGRCLARPDDTVFRTADGRPLSARRYDTIFGRARTALDWSERDASLGARPAPHRHHGRRPAGGLPGRAGVRRPRPTVGHRAIPPRHPRRDRSGSRGPHRRGTPTHRESSPDQRRRLHDL